jgi:hypothetical protein
MKTFLLVLSICFSLNALAYDGPSIDENQNLILGASAEAALNKFDAGFKILTINAFAKTVRGYFEANEAPMALILDFNKDGTRDVVLMGITSKGQRILVALISKAKTYQVQRIDDLDFEDPKTAKLGNEPGLYQYVSRAEGLGRRTGFQYENLISLGNPVIVFVWNGKQFVAR